MIWVWITAGSRGGVPRRWGRKASAAPSAAAIGRLTAACSSSALLRHVARRLACAIPAPGSSAGCDGPGAGGDEAQRHQETGALHGVGHGCLSVIWRTFSSKTLTQRSTLRLAGLAASYSSKRAPSKRSRIWSRPRRASRSARNSRPASEIVASSKVAPWRRGDADAHDAARGVLPDRGRLPALDVELALRLARRRRGRRSRPRPACRRAARGSRRPPCREPSSRQTRRWLSGRLSQLLRNTASSRSASPSALRRYPCWGSTSSSQPQPDVRVGLDHAAFQLALDRDVLEVHVAPVVHVDLDLAGGLLHAVDRLAVPPALRERARDAAQHRERVVRAAEAAQTADEVHAVGARAERPHQAGRGDLGVDLGAAAVLDLQHLAAFEDALELRRAPARLRRTELADQLVGLPEEVVGLLSQAREPCTVRGLLPDDGPRQRVTAQPSRVRRRKLERLVPLVARRSRSPAAPWATRARPRPRPEARASLQ